MRAVVDYTRGVVFALLGFFFVFFDKWGIDGIEFQPWYRYLGGLFIVYGLWRIYRGSKKNYYK